jgi:hypothetical protein
MRGRRTRAAGRSDPRPRRSRRARLGERHRDLRRARRRRRSREHGPQRDGHRLRHRRLRRRRAYVDPGPCRVAERPARDLRRPAARHAQRHDRREHHHRQPLRHSVRRRRGLHVAGRRQPRGGEHRRRDPRALRHRQHRVPAERRFRQRRLRDVDLRLVRVDRRQHARPQPRRRVARREHVAAGGRLAVADRWELRERQRRPRPERRHRRLDRSRRQPGCAQRGRAAVREPRLQARLDGARRLVLVQRRQRVVRRRRPSRTA